MIPMPVEEAIRLTSSSRSIPSLVPNSLKPAELMMAPLTPFSAHSLSIGMTFAA